MTRVSLDRDLLCSLSYGRFVQVDVGTTALEMEQGCVAFGPGSVFHFPAGLEHAAVFETETVLVETNLPT